jgi:hypothetical protein
MQMQGASELAARLVEAVIPWLDHYEYGVLYMALGTEPNRRIITALLDIAAQKQCVLPTSLAEDLSNWRRPHRTVHDPLARNGLARNHLSQLAQMLAVVPSPTQGSAQRGCP